MGNGGDDVIMGGAGADTLYGGSGKDLFYESDDGVTDVIYGGSNTDTVTYETSDHGVLLTLGESGNAGNAYVIYSTSTSTGFQLHSVLEDQLYDVENVTGSDQSDTPTGNSGDNVLIGGWGGDTLVGGRGNDTLDGGRDHDVLTGGLDSDTFRFSTMGETGSSADLITDFQTGVDHIDFSPFYSHAFENHIFHSDTLPLPTFLGSGAFTGAGNELRITTNAAHETVVQLDLPTEETNGGTGTADVEIVVHGTTPVFHDFLF
jgi:hypothetical protein